MQKRNIEGVEVQRSSANVFADLGLPDAKKLKIKTDLVIEIRKAMRTLGLTQQAAAERMGIPQPKVSGMMRGDFTNLSDRKLLDCLNRLNVSIQIGSTSVYADLGHADAAGMQRKSQLAGEIARAIKARRLTQEGAAALLGIDQSKVSRITRGQFRGVSEAKLLELIAKLGHDV
jgi:predicted XRE-type DNA-binding protein